MTGIDRLRTLAGAWDEWGLGGALEDVARQIERERACDADTIENVRLIVGGVIDDMERHTLGHEGMEDSPVARWARELRRALKSDTSDAAEQQKPSWHDPAETAGVTSEAEKVTRDPADDVSVSAYDLLPEEDRDAIAWVREHGGLDAVRRRWECLSYYADLVSRSCMEKRLARLQRQIDESHAALRRRREVISELNHRACDLTRENAELRKCAERGETIRELSGKVAKQSDEIRVMRDVIAETCARLGVEGTGSTVDDAQVIWREISRRLMPEGMEWLVESWPRFEDDAPVCNGDEISWRDEGGVVNSIELQDGGYFILHAADGAEDWIFPQYFPGERVKRPAPKVLDADGAEIRVGDALYYTATGCKATVRGINSDGTIELDGHENRGWRADRFAHRAPVLAADGRPLREGEHVYHVETGAELVVKELPKPGEYQAVVVFYPPASHLMSFDPDQLTHTKPEIDTWERIEEDAKKPTCDYFGHVGGETCETCPGYADSSPQGGRGCRYAHMADLVRRAEKLAGVSE